MAAIEKKPAKRAKKKYTAAETAEWRKGQRELRAEMLKDAATAMLTSEGFQRWIEFRKRTNHYSARNLMLIVMQMPEASYVMKYGDWPEVGRHVRKGEHGLKVFAPLFRRPTDEEIAAGHPANQKVLYSYRLVPTFDVSQTEGDPIPELDVQPLTGDSHEHLLAPLRRFAKKLGYSVAYEDLPGEMGGYCDASAKRIVIGNGATPNHQVRVLVHELAHALGVGYVTYGREAAECIVETATYIVLGGLGLDTSPSSVAYVASWGEDDQLAAVQKFANVIDNVARQIEEVLA